MSYKVVKINNVYKVPKINNVYKVVYEAEITPPAPTGPVFDLDASNYITSNGNWSDKDAFLRGENVSLTLYRSNYSALASVKLTCSDWTDVAKIQISVSSGSWYNTGYNDNNDSWHDLTAIKSGNTITISIPSNIRSSIKNLSAISNASWNDTFSNFIVYDDNDNIIIPAS